MTTHTLGLEGQSWETSTIHILNTVVYLAIIVCSYTTIIVILNWRRSNQTKYKEIDLYVFYDSKRKKILNNKTQNFNEF
jgi:hypothetical protein